MGFRNFSKRLRDNAEYFGGSDHFPSNKVIFSENLGINPQKFKFFFG